MFAPSDAKKVASVTECFPLSLLSVTLRAGKHKSLVTLNEKEGKTNVQPETET